MWCVLLGQNNCCSKWASALGEHGGGTWGGEDGGSERARGSEEINESDGRTSGATGAAGVSTVDPDGGAGILEDEQGDGAQSRWWRQTFSNGWLKHLEMMFARAVVSAI